ncbi:MAG: cell division protein FtsA [Bacteroidales bacterium]|nr:cell division protein FtsA [Bacteroidales bacterium]
MENTTQQQGNFKSYGNDRIVVGIDVGTTKIAVFIGKKDDKGKITIIGMGKTPSVGVEHGEVKVITKTADSIKIAVEQAEKRCNIKVTEAYVGIAGHNIKNSLLRGTKIIKEDDHIITQEDIDELLEDQYNISMPPGDSIIDIVPQDYIIDGETGIPDPVGRIGKVIECNYNLISGDETNVHNIYRSVKLAGYKVKGLILEPIASAEAVVNANEKDAGICLVDIGGGTTDMAIFQNGILRHTAVIQLAGNSITNDVKDACRIMLNQAEALKTHYGDCLQTEKQQNTVIQIPALRGRESREITLYMLAGIIKARVEMILQQVDYELKNDSYDKMLIAGIVLTGGGSKLQHIAQYTEYITGITTRVGEPDSTWLSENVSDSADPIYSTGIGLVLKGFEYEQKFADNNPASADEIKTEPAEPKKEEPEDTKTESGKGGKKPKKAKKQKDGNSRFIDKITDFFAKFLNDTVE